MPALQVEREVFPIRGSFAISRGSKTEAHVVTVALRDGDALGRGECVPYARYGESVESVVAAIEAERGAIEAGLDRAGLARRLAPGAARNALDCALWDLEAKRRGVRAWDLAGLPAPDGIVTAYTLSLAAPAAMGEAAAAARSRPLLKLKLAGDGADIDRVAAVREAAPAARLIVDANEGWAAADAAALLREMARLQVELVEQPLPAGDDAALAEIEHPVPVCADESCHSRDGLAELAGRYDLVNIKLDKTGGLTEALALATAARAAGMALMVGCMLGTSLAMAPALLPAHRAEVVDLDGPLLLARDREPALVFDGSTIRTPPPALWG